MNPIKLLKCLFVGHTLDTPSIVNTICRNNWLKKCSCCGLYIMHGYLKRNGFIYNWEVDDLEKRKRQGKVVAWIPIFKPQPYKKEEEPCITKEFAEECKEVAKKYEKPMTNADRIRNMSDEELAEFLAELNACEKCKYDSSMGCLFENPCTKSFAEAMALEWIQAEVEEGE